MKHQKVINFSILAQNRLQILLTSTKKHAVIDGRCWSSRHSRDNWGCQENSQQQFFRKKLEAQFYFPFSRKFSIPTVSLRIPPFSCNIRGAFFGSCLTKSASTFDYIFNHKRSKVLSCRGRNFFELCHYLLQLKGTLAKNNGHSTDNRKYHKLSKNFPDYASRVTKKIFRVCPLKKFHYMQRFQYFGIKCKKISYARIRTRYLSIR